MKNKLVTLALLLVAILGVGCAGDKEITPTTGGGNAFEGVYNATYTRGVIPAGEMVIGVTSNDAVEVAIHDTAAGFFRGTGTLHTDNTFSVLCHNEQQDTDVVVTGTFSGTGAGRTIDGTVAGEFSVTYTASFSHSPSTTVYANHYEGFYGGQAQGTFMFDVAANGAVSGTVTAGGHGNLPLTGTVSSTGVITWHAQLLGGEYSMDFEGILALHPTTVMGDGTYHTSANESGSWNAGNSNEG